METLYSRDSKGNIVEWSGYIEGQEFSNDCAKIIINEGLFTGIKTRYERLLKKGKNIGKINETTSYEQAVFELRSKYQKKKKQGYKSLNDLSITEEYFNNSAISKEGLLDGHLPKFRTDENNLLKPMKCSSYFKDDSTPRITFPCIGQPKLNGFRVMCRWEEVEEGEGIFKTMVEKPVFRSKEGLRYTILEHIENELKKEYFRDTFSGTDNYDVVFDGEIYIHGELLSEISSAVRKRNSKTEKLKFHIFDLAIDKIKQSNRIALLDQYKVKFLNNKVTNSVIINSTFINSNEQAQNMTNQWIEQGYEGGVFRDIKATYQFSRRPQTIVKLKRFQDKEFSIIDVVSGENSPELGIFVCIQEQGLQFKVSPEGSHEIKKEYLINKAQYIGKKLTVRFFERTKDNIPFHAIGIAIRDYE